MTEAGQDAAAPLRVYRSALYVDFDNLYSGLRQVDEDAASEFGNDPGRLLGMARHRFGRGGALPPPVPDRRLLSEPAKSTPASERSSWPLGSARSTARH